MEKLDAESITSYDSIKNDAIFLKSLRGKYVTLQLIQKCNANGFVRAIDPEGHSIILLKPNGDTYQTNLIPGHAILGISVKETLPGINPVNKLETNFTGLEERKTKLMSWFKKNLLQVTEKDDNIVFKNVLILPPYDIKSIYSTNIIVTKQVRDIIEKMPVEFTE